MRAALAATLVCFASTLVYCAGAEEGATKPTPPEVIDAIKKLGGSVKVDKRKVVVEVDLDSTKVTDAGLEHLKGLTKLEELYFSSPKVTDAGLVHLKGLTNLTHLLLSETKVTPAGVKNLRQALPNCIIKH